MWEAGKWNFLRPSYRSCRECCLDEFSFFFLFARSCLSRSCNYIFRYHGPFPRSLMLNMGYDYPRVTGKTGSEVAHVYASVWFCFFALSLSYRIFKNEEISNHINKLILPRSKNILRSPSTLVRPKGGRVRKRQRRYVRILTNRKILFFPARIQSSKQKKNPENGTNEKQRTNIHNALASFEMLQINYPGSYSGPRRRTHANCCWFPA